jgi:hypothetical protein
MATIITKNSQTASAVPSAASLSVGELAVNTADGKLYTEHTGGVVKEIIPSTVVDNGISTTKIADSAVTTAKIANANVTVAKLSATGTPSSTTFLRGDGSWTAPAGGGFTGNFQAFTSSGTFNVPAGVSRVKVTVIGAGGNAGNGPGGSVCSGGDGGGGGAGGYVVDYVAVTPGGTASVSVGTNAGTRTSSFAGGTTITAAGGSNGTNGANNLDPRSGASGASTIFGVTNYQAGPYRRNFAAPNTFITGGNISTASNQPFSTGQVYGHGFGVGGNGPAASNASYNAIGYGAGGGGGGSASYTYVNGGGTGTNGLVIVEW